MEEDDLPFSQLGGAICRFLDHETFKKLLLFFLSFVVFGAK